MKKIGIIGGIGPESTLDYYRGIINYFKPHFSQRGYPEIIIDSVNLKQLTERAAAGEWSAVTDDFAARFELMRTHGADTGAIASNTPHFVFDAIQARTKLPLISIVDAVRNEACTRKRKHLLLLGTKFTMNAQFYQKAFLESGITLALPTEEEIDLIHARLFSEIELGIIKDSTRRELIAIVERAAKEESIDGVILGCTELPLILLPEDLPLPSIDSCAAHINAICRAIDL